MYDTERMTTREKADAVVRLLEATPDGVVRDADTILKDIMDEADFELSGIAKEIIDIWKSTADEEAFERLFQSFTGWGFSGWLDRCIHETTVAAGNGEDR